ANGVFISGVEIAATAFSNLLADTPVKPIGLSYYVLVILLWGMIAGIFCRLSHIGVAALGSIGLCAIYIVGAKYQFTAHYVWYPIAVPLFLQSPLAFFGAVVWNYVDAKKERVNIQKAFEHYLPKDVVAQLARDVAHIRTGGQVVYGVCLFTDAQHYTALSETMDPHELGKFMNRYYETMFRPVKRHGGFVSGVIGDSMLALWVAARSEAKLKNNACMAAVDINRELDLFEGVPGAGNLKTRIGLHCGEILLGHVGALDHYEYTPMGDIVNTASRIETLNKHLGTSVLVSDEVVEQANGFLSRDLGRFKLKGKANPIGVYELVCPIEEADEKVKSVCDIFAEALDAFRKGSWDEAMDKFQRSREILGEDGPSSFYVGLCRRYRENPPEEPRDGVVHMEQK
ncbi:MAG: adenylate/guanylate cyclase domain-containing protein, partial [Deltaproteobacteria bacterium]|nr:adenylate/guanylate cyclase domain-containing protein [Deltaproteobacteria bacterium]